MKQKKRSNRERVRLRRMLFCALLLAGALSAVIVVAVILIRNWEQLSQVLALFAAAGVMVGIEGWVMEDGRDCE